VLFEMVRAIGESLCPALGIAIPVGKDSLSMRTVWRDDGGDVAVTAPVSLIVSAFAPVKDVRRTLTPELRRDAGDTVLLLLDIANGRCRLGGSALAQCYGEFGGAVADLDDPQRLTAFFAGLRALREADLVLAYHDRSDGGVLTTAVEMAFAANVGLAMDLPEAAADPLAFLFNEEPGALIQVRSAELPRVERILERAGLGAALALARPVDAKTVVIRRGTTVIFEAPLTQLRGWWSELSFRMQELRDNPECAREAFAALRDDEDPGLNVRLTFDVVQRARREPRGSRPKLAILREQGVNSQREMAAAFDRAGFETHDLHMTDLMAGRARLQDYRGVVACGGFSYGDVLGAGEGWAKSILYNAGLREAVQAFFAREDVFALGVCNGCQMLAALKALIPGTASWPRFVRNRSDQFEARLSLLRVESGPSVLLAGMAGSCLPIVTSHGEGRAKFESDDAMTSCAGRLVDLRYVDHDGRPAERYPANPNGSPQGIAGLSNEDGRVTIMMPHPERSFRSTQLSWHPPEWGEDSPWMRLFDNARAWVDAVS
jgi:phosphoribosylformylglycinamidine synthase